MKSCKEHTVGSGGLAVRIQFWRPEPRRLFVRFQSKHVYRNVSKPFCLAVE